MNLAPVTLDGAHVRLEPVIAPPVDGRWQAGRDPDVWLPDGFVRDSGCFSVVDHEWPDVRATSKRPWPPPRRSSHRRTGRTKPGRTRCGDGIAAAPGRTLPTR